MYGMLQLLRVPVNYGDYDGEREGEQRGTTEQSSVIECEQETVPVRHGASNKRERE